jgi:hypothetical protein
MDDGLISIYQPQMMIQALERAAAPKRFFHSKFFGTVRTHTTQNVMFDVRTKKRRVATFTGPIHDATVIEREGFITKTTAPAYVKEKTTLRPQEVLTRGFNENPFAATSPAQRAAQALGEDLAMLDERIVRLEEKMCAEAILTGKVKAKGKGIDVEVDFGYVAGEHLIDLTGSSKWDDTSADPMRDLDNWRRKIVQRTGITPDICVVGNRAGWAIMDNPKVKERLNIINYQMGRVNPSNQPSNGTTYYGDLMLPSGVVSLHCYDEWYTDPNTGDDVPLLPDNVVLLGSTQARCEFHYGMIQNLKSMQPSTRFAFSWEADNGSARFVQLESAPMPNLFEPDAFIVATVLDPV